MASRDCGRATPPPKFDHPPKYDPEIYEDSGKALAIAILDLTESNPWTRLTCSAYKNLRGVRDWLRKYIKAKAEEEAEKAANQSPKKVSSSAKSARSTARRVRIMTYSAPPQYFGKKLYNSKKRGLSDFHHITWALSMFIMLCMTCIMGNMETSRERPKETLSTNLSL